MTTTPTARDYARVVRRIVALGSGVDSSNVIPGNDTYPAPLNLYATVLLVSSWAEGGPFESTPNEDGEARSLLNVTSRFSVQWYRAGAVEAATRFRMWCESQDGADAIRARGVILSRCGELRRLDYVISSNFEERAGLDITLRHVQSMSVDRRPVEAVEVQFDSAAGTEEASIDGP